MEMRACPRWQGCSAPICPLDSSHLSRRHLDGERVCFWLIEASKRGGRLPVDPRVPGVLAETVEEAFPHVVSRFGPVRRELKRAAKRGSRLAAMLGGGTDAQV